MNEIEFRKLRRSQAPHCKSMPGGPYVARLSTFRRFPFGGALLAAVRLETPLHSADWFSVCHYQFCCHDCPSLSNAGSLTACAAMRDGEYESVKVPPLYKIGQANILSMFKVIWRFPVTVERKGVIVPLRFFPLPYRSKKLHGAILYPAEGCGIYFRDDVVHALKWIGASGLREGKDYEFIVEEAMMFHLGNDEMPFQRDNAMGIGLRTFMKSDGKSRRPIRATSKRKPSSCRRIRSTENLPRELAVTVSSRRRQQIHGGPVRSPQVAGEGSGKPF